MNLISNIIKNKKNKWSQDHIISHQERKDQHKLIVKLSCKFDKYLIASQEKMKVLLDQLY